MPRKSCAQRTPGDRDISQAVAPTTVTEPEPTRKPRLRSVSNLLKLVTIAVAVYATAVAVRHAQQPLLEVGARGDHYGFRQTQTAITAFWMIKDGWRLAYETPVAGYPWSIPFEFPLYQTLVAAASKFGHLPLDSVGRLVSFVFLLGCAWPASAIATRLTLPRRAVWVFCALLWSSPIYIFWGRTFMIETAALFFAFAAIPYGLDLFNAQPRWNSVILCAFFGALASLQKVTTGAPVVLVLWCMYLVHWCRRDRLRVPSVREITTVVCAFGLPILIATAWTLYTDAIKARNPLGAQLTSAALTGWTFGTLTQRLALSTYVNVVWDRMIAPNAGGIFGAVLIAAAALVPATVRVRAITASALALCMLPVLLFTNLHIVHDYYQSSCALFLIAALALAVGVWVPGVVPYPVVVPALTLLLVILNLHAYAIGYRPIARQGIGAPQNRLLAIATVVRENTSPDSGFVAFGEDWNSELAYYAQRKSFTVPEFFREYSRAWHEPAGFLGDTPLRALVVCPSKSGPTLADAARRLESEPRWMLVEVSDCGVLIDRNKSGQE
jgi:hypothetical protein